MIPINIFKRSPKNSNCNSTRRAQSETIIETNNDPYILDYAIYHEMRIPALTRKNANFIEAVVGLDSNYNRDSDIEAAPDCGFNPINNVSSSNGKYCGSAAYWFHKMENGGDFKECLLGAIISIDRTNSTHLEAAVDGRIKIRDIILNLCQNVSELKRELNKDFSSNPKKHLIGLMSVEMPAKGRGNRSNLSFASKFCSYASIYLRTELEYSKYDNVVASHLGKYISAYLKKETVDPADYRYDSGRKNKSADRLQYTVNIYINYYQLIGCIISSLKEQNVNINRNEFDHIVWYGFKGS